MEKRTKIRHISRFSRYISGFSPITEATNYPMYMILTVRFENFQRWPETEKITKEEFEKELHNNPELVDAYLDVFSNSAEFFLCKVSDKDLIFHYCIMYLNKQIVMLYYRKLFMIVD